MATAKMISVEPEVKLTNAFVEPFKNFVSTARTCYSSKGLVDLRELSPRDLQIAESIYRAGHHTTLQHGHFQFTLDNVSRQFIWSFLHSHPFYNSEQVSQRYVAVKPGNFAVPPLEGEALEIYLETIEEQTATYQRLCRELIPVTEAQYLKRFPHRSLEKSQYRRDIKKKAQEIARYVLPVATFAYLYHTVSGISLLRYWRCCRQFDVPLEQKIVVGKMVEQLLRLDPNFGLILEEPLPLEETPEWAWFERFHREGEEPAPHFRREFDEDLGRLSSRLVDWKINNEEVLAAAVRETLGLPRNALSREDAIELALNPARNRLLGESMNLTTMSKLSRAMVHAHYTFRKKLSHTADSQDQRHRMTPASRPILAAHWSGEPDYITPALVLEDPDVQRIYDAMMAFSWRQMRRLRRMGVPAEFALYLSPNATAVRFTESGDLLNLRHKYAMRLCYNAQEEIWRASLEEVRQISEINPLIGRRLLPPCSLRSLAGQRPVCPEGERYCGVKVWKMGLDDYHRVI